uniref:E1B 55k protein n=1 Tax=Rhinolophus ferrumequinum adenovirus TaxID=3140013 RepID=A0AAU6S572_9ADEN
MESHLREGEGWEPSRGRGGLSAGDGEGGLVIASDTSSGDSTESGLGEWGLASGGDGGGSRQSGGSGGTDSGPGGDSGGQRQRGGECGSGDGGGFGAGGSVREQQRQQSEERDPLPGCSWDGGYVEQQQRGRDIQPIVRGRTTGLFGQLLQRQRRRRSGRSRAPSPRRRSRSRSRDRLGLDTEQISWRDIVDDYHHNHELYSEQYNFDQVITHVMQPGENWSEMLKLHAKVSLDPEKVYHLSEKIDVEAPCYVIGKGAKVLVGGNLDNLIQVHPKTPGPSVTNMWGVVFSNVNFERDGAFTGVLARCHSFTTFHGCVFSGFTGTVIQMLAGGEVKGCCFLACYRCVINESRNMVLIKSCVIDKCILGVICRGPCRVVYSTFRETYCAALFQVHGSFKFCSVIDPTALSDRSDLSLGTCAEGNMTMLCSVHVVSNFSAQQVDMSHLNLLRADIYVGYRRGLWHCPQSTFNFSRLYVTNESMSRVSLTAVYTATLRVMRIYRPDYEHSRGRLCECGATHSYFPLMLTEVTNSLIQNPCLNSVDSLDFSSDEDDQVGVTFFGRVKMGVVT